MSANPTRKAMSAWFAAHMQYSDAIEAIATKCCPTCKVSGELVTELDLKRTRMRIKGCKCGRVWDDTMFDALVES